MTSSDKRILIASAVLIPLMVAVAVRMWQMTGYPRGEYNSVTAPNKRHRAYVYVLTDMDFFGGVKRYYTFEVEMGLSDDRRKTIYKERYNEMDLSRPIDLDRLGDSVTWSPDSSKVSLSLGWKDIEFDVPF